MATLIKKGDILNDMVYKDSDFVGRQILDSGTCRGFNYFIISFGTHPCCYVEIPKQHECYGKHYDEIDIDCHGGLTFSSDHVIAIDETGEKWFIGWDFAHLDDYFYSNDYFTREGHKWTTEELKEEVRKVCEQLYDKFRMLEVA